MLVLLDEAGDLVAGRDPTILERVAVHLRASKLDRALAAGVSPDTNAMLALRAQALVRPQTRHELALALQRTLADAVGPCPGAATPVIFAGLNSVRALAGVFQVLIDRVAAPAPVSAQGIAQVRLLLTDGRGPLYCRGSTDDLRASVLAAVEALRPAYRW